MDAQNSVTPRVMAVHNKQILRRLAMWGCGESWLWLYLDKVLNPVSIHQFSSHLHVYIFLILWSLLQLRWASNNKRSSRNSNHISDILPIHIKRMLRPYQQFIAVDVQRRAMRPVRYIWGTVHTFAGRREVICGAGAALPTNRTEIEIFILCDASPMRNHVIKSATSVCTALYILSVKEDCIGCDLLAEWGWDSGRKVNKSYIAIIFY